MQSTLTIYFPRKLVIGNGTMAQLTDEIKQLHPSKVFIVTIEPLNRVVAKLSDELKAVNIITAADTSVVQEPSFNDFEKLMKDAAAFDPDIVIGIGGGSVLDIAKLVAAQLANEHCKRDYLS